jgi:CHASE3 domain sensor protein
VISLLDILSDLEDTEGRERGYLLTGGPSYQEAFNSSRKALDEDFERLRDLAKNNPKELNQIERLRNLVHQRLDELQATIDTRTKAGFEAAQAMVLTAMESNSRMPFAKTSSGWKRRSRAR